MESATVGCRQEGLPDSSVTPSGLKIQILQNPPACDISRYLLETKISMSSSIKTVKELVTYFEGLTTWESKNSFIANLKGTRSKTIDINGTVYRIGKSGRTQIMRSFRRMVCEFNRKQMIDQPVRSLFNGNFIQPGTANYTKTLKACGVRRLYSTCKEILSSEGQIPNPDTGANISKDSVKGRRLIRRCLKGAKRT